MHAIYGILVDGILEVDAAFAEAEDIVIRYGDDNNWYQPIAFIPVGGEIQFPDNGASNRYTLTDADKSRTHAGWIEWLSQVMVFEVNDAIDMAEFSLKEKGVYTELERLQGPSWQEAGRVLLAALTTVYETASTWSFRNLATQLSVVMSPGWPFPFTSPSWYETRVFCSVYDDPPEQCGIVLMDIHN